MTNIKDKTALITGGASGIGRITGELLLQRGLGKLIIWDIDESAMERTAEALQGKGYKVSAYAIDMRKRDQIITRARETLEAEGTPDLLVNNAGIVTGSYFHQQTHEQIEATMEVNTLAFQHTARAFLEAMMQRGSGHIVNIASAAGMLANPRMSVYCASKWAVIGWSESLRIEMEQLKTGIRLTTVTPYYTDTGMFRGISSVKLLPVLKPVQVARRIVRGIKRNRLFVRTPLIIYALPFFKGILPARWFDWYAGRLFGVYQSMEHFKGHAHDQ